MTESLPEIIAKEIWHDRFPDRAWDSAPAMDRCDFRGHARAVFELGERTLAPRLAEAHQEALLLLQRAAADVELNGNWDLAQRIEAVLAKAREG
jgi:hypothetical protein